MKNTANVLAVIGLCRKLERDIAEAAGRRGQPFWDETPRTDRMLGGRREQDGDIECMILLCRELEQELELQRLIALPAGPR